MNFDFVYPPLLLLPERRAHVREIRPRIQVIAAQVLRRHWHPHCLPVQPQTLAPCYGMRVRALKCQASLRDRILGRVVRDEDQLFIEVACTLTHAMQRFVIAHMLGHHLLDHADVRPEMISHFQTDAESALDHEANYFAMNLLVPMPLIIRMLNVGIDTVEEMAKDFQVPLGAISLRLTELMMRRLG